MHINMIKLCIISVVSGIMVESIVVIKFRDRAFDTVPAVGIHVVI